MLYLRPNLESKYKLLIEKNRILAHRRPDHEVVTAFALRGSVNLLTIAFDFRCGLFCDDRDTFHVDSLPSVVFLKFALPGSVSLFFFYFCEYFWFVICHESARQRRFPPEN